MKKQKIIFVSHCILNTSSKICSNDDSLNDEAILRKNLLKHLFENEIDIFQLPCPEVTLYGSKRWGHVRNQFDNIFFRNHCRKILIPVIEQLNEYMRNERFKVVGILGINGSPSCGVEFSCESDEWFGEFSLHENFEKVKNSVAIIEQKGIFIEELCNMLKENYINIKMCGINGNTLDNIIKFFEI